MFGKPINKIKVKVIRDPQNLVVVRPVEVSSDGRKAVVIMEKPTDKRAGWQLDVTDCVRIDSDGKPYVETFQGSSKAIRYTTANNLVNITYLTNDEILQFAKMSIFKNHYGNLIEDIIKPLKLFFIVTMILVVVSIAISGYNAYAMSKLPETFVQIAATPTPTPTVTPNIIG